MPLGLLELHESAAYHAGRFLAVCQHIQNLTSDEINATYVDRFFSAACSTPGAVLPRVYKVAARRLRKVDDRKLRDDIESTLLQLNQQVEEAWPKHLGIQEQSLFQLGFFHQTAALPCKDWRRRILTARGEAVKSSGERTIANILCSMPYKEAQEYLYEEVFVIPGSESKSETMTPDFTIHNSDQHRTLFIEYTGMIGSQNYDTQWTWKSSRYRKLGRTIEDCMLDGNFGNYTLMQVLPNDRLNLRQFEVRLKAAVTAFLEGQVTPNVRQAWESGVAVDLPF